MERSSGAYNSEAAPTIFGKSVNKRIQQPCESLVKANMYDRSMASSKNRSPQGQYVSVQNILCYWLHLLE